MNLKIFITFLLTTLLNIYLSYSADKISVYSGNWNVDSVWSPVGVPAAGDNVIVSKEHTITVTANAACVNLIVNGILSIGGINFSSSAITIIDGTILVTSNTGNKSFGSIIMNEGSFFTSNAAETYSIGGSFIMSGGNIDGTATGIFTIMGLFTVSSGTTNIINAATITANNGIQVDGLINFASNLGNKTFGDISINNGGEWNSTGNESFTVLGNFINYGVFNAGTGTYTFSGAVKNIITNNNTIFNNLAITGSYTNNDTLTVNTALSGAGLLTNNSVLFIKGTSTITTLVANIVPNTVIYNSTTANQTIKGTTYYNLIIDKSGRIATLGAACNIDNNLEIIAGTLADGGYQITGNTTGVLSVFNGSTLQLGTTASSTSFPTDFITSNINLETNSTIIYNSNLEQIISSSPSAYGNLTLTATAAVTKTCSAPLFINGTLTIGINNTLADAGFTITAKGNVVNNGAYSGSGKLLLTNGSVPHAISVATSSFGNIELNDEQGATFAGSGTTTIYGTFKITSGTLTLNAFTTSLVVEGNTIINGTLQIASATGTKVFNNITVNADGIWNCTVAEAITINGNIQNNGLFTANTSAYTFAGTDKTINGTISIPSINITGSYTNYGVLTCTTTFTGTGSFTNAANSTLYIGGTNTIATFIVSANNNSVYYNSTAANQIIFPTTYHNLYIDKLGRTATLANDININGLLSIKNGILADGGYQIIGNSSGSIIMDSLTTLTLGTTTSASLFPTNVLTSNITLHKNSTVIYNSNISQNISGTPTYGNLTLSATAAVTKTATNNITINGNLTINTNNALADNGFTLTIKGNIINNATINGSGKIILTGGETNHSISGGTSNFVTIELDDSQGATFTGTGNTTLTGNLVITNGTLTLNSFTSLNVTGNTIIGNGINTSGLVINSVTGTKTFNGLVTINENATWDNPANEAINFCGGISNNGTFNAGTAVQTFINNPQTLTGILAISRVTVTGISLTNTNELTINTALAGTGELIQSENATLYINFTGAVGISTLIAHATGNTVYYNFSGGQTIKAPSTAYYNLICDGSGTKTLAAAITIYGNFSINNGVTFADGGFSLQVRGNIINNGIHSGNGNITFTGGTTIHSISGTGTLRNLVLNDGYGALLNNNLSLTGNLTLTNGLLYLGNYDIILSTTSTIVGTPSSSNMVVTNGSGQFIKTIPTGASSFTFPIGDNTDIVEYSPVYLSFSANATSGTVGVRVMDTKHSSNSQSDNYITRYWSFTTNSLTTYTYFGSFFYTDSDVVGDNEAMFFAQRYDNSTLSWTTDMTSSTDVANHKFTTGSLNETTGKLNNNDFTSYKNNENEGIYYWSKATGNWNGASVWEITTTPVDPGVGNGTPTAVAPTYDNNDGIFLRSGYTVTLATNATANQLKILNGATLSLANYNLTLFNDKGYDLILESTATLNTTTGRIIANDTGVIISISGTFNTYNSDGFSGTENTSIAISNSPTILLNSGSTVNYALNGAQTITVIQPYKNLRISGGNTKTLAGAITVEENLTISAGTLADAGNIITINGNIINSGTHSGNGKILLSGGTDVHIISGRASIFGNIELDDELGATMSGTATTTISKNLLITKGTFTLNAFTTALVVTGSTTIGNSGYSASLIMNSTTGTKTFTGLFTVGNNGTFSNAVNEAITIQGGIVNNGIFTAGTATYTFNTNSQLLQGILTISNIRVTGITLTNNGTLTNSTSLTGTGTLINNVNAVLNIGGTITITTLNASANNNYVYYNSTTANQTIKSATYHNLIISKIGRTATLGGAITVNGDLYVTGGTLSDNGYQITGNASGNFDMSANTILILGNTTTATNFPTNFIKVNISLNTTSTVRYNANVTQSISSVPIYGGLSLTSTATVVKTVNGATTIKGTLNIGANNTLANGGYTLTLNGSFVNNGTHSGAGKILLTGGNTSHSLSGASASYGNLELNDNQGASITSLGSVTIGNLVITNGTFTLNSFTTGLTVTGTTDIYGTILINNNAGTKSFNNIFLYYGSTWNCAVIEDFTINGDFYVYGTLTPNTGTYSFTGSNKMLVGNITLNTISIQGTYTNYDYLTVNTSLQGAGTLTNNENAIIDLKGVNTISNLITTANFNTVKYTSTSANQIVRATNYYHLVIDKGVYTAQLEGAILINGNLIVSSGTLDDAGYQITGNSTGNFSLSNDAVLILGSGIKSTAFPTNFSTANISLGTSSTVKYNASALQYVSAIPSHYGNLIIDGANRKVLQNNILIKGNLVINTDTFDVSTSNYNITLSGNFVNFGIFIPRKGTILFDNNTTLSGTSEFSFNNIVITGVLTPPSLGNINVSGNWTNNGTFIHNNGTVTFNGAGRKIVNNHNGTETFNNVTISGGGSACLVIPPTKSIHVLGLLTVNDSLYLQSDVTGTAQLLDNGISGSGKMIAEQYVTNKVWHYVSSPVNNATAASFKGVGSNMYYYDEQQAKWIQATSLTPLGIMQGFNIYVNVTTAKTSLFSGAFNTGAQSINVSKIRDGWNLIGNPYPSAIDWDAGTGWTKTNIANAIYIWNSALNNFASYIDGIGVNGGMRYIAPMQAFWVLAEGNGVVGVTNEVRLIKTSNFLKNINKVANTLIITVTGNSYNDQTVIRFNELATYNFDNQYDAYKKLSYDYVPQIYTKSDDNVILSINTIPPCKPEECLAVTMYFKVNVPTNYSLSFNGINEFSEDLMIYIEDKKTGIWQDLRSNSVYDFTYSLGDAEDRFVIHFGQYSTNILNNNNHIQFNAYYSNGNIMFLNPYNHNASVEIINVLGEVVYSNNIFSSFSIPFNATGIYIVRISTSEYNYTKKLFCK